MERLQPQELKLDGSEVLEQQPDYEAAKETVDALQELQGAAIIGRSGLEELEELVASYKEHTAGMSDAELLEHDLVLFPGKQN